MNGRDRFETEYTGFEDFESRNAKNYEIIRAHYVPEIRAAGMGHNLKMDVDPIELSDDDKADYPNPNDFTARAGIRSPDIIAIDGRMVIKNAAWINEAYMEVKDFPRMSLVPETGCEARLVMRYLAIQHLFKRPVFILFRDTDREAKDGLPPMAKAFDGRPYGGLLWDLSVSLNSLRTKFKNKKGNPQVLWHVYNDITKEPLMSTIQGMADELRSGRIAMKQVDPAGHPLWNMLNSAEKWEDWPGRMRPSPMRVPDGGLVVFTGKP